MKSKGQLGNLQGIVMVILFIGVILSAGYFILAEFSDQLDDNAQTITNETLGNSSVYVNVARAGDQGFNSFSLTEVLGQRNQSGAWITIALANVTTNSSGAVLWIGDASLSDINGTYLNISYNYERGDASFVSVIDTIGAMDTATDLLSLIVLIAMIVIILFLVFTMPGARGNA